MNSRLDTSPEQVQLLHDTLIAMRVAQIRQETIVTQAINVRRLQRAYFATHTHDALIAAKAAENVLDDLLDQQVQPRLRGIE